MKARKKFEEWLIKNHRGVIVNRTDLAIYMEEGEDGSLSSLVYWSDLSYSMQLGVYLEFFDSIDPELTPIVLKECLEWVKAGAILELAQEISLRNGLEILEEKL